MDWIPDLVMFLQLMAAVIGLMLYRRLSPPFRLLVALLCIGACVEVLAMVLSYTSLGNHLIYNLFTIADGCMVFAIYHNLDRMHRREHLILMFLALGLMIGATLTARPEAGLLARNVIICSLFQVIVALLYFKSMLQMPAVESLGRHAGFWFTTSLLVYEAVTFFRWTIFDLDVARNLSFAVFYWVNLVMLVTMVLVRVWSISLDARHEHLRAHE